jgi:hypothetical protein
MYYPKSQIKTNLSTNGGEFILSTTKQEYIGSYYETSNGNKYAGKSPQDSTSILLNESPQLVQASHDPQVTDLIQQNLIQTFLVTPDYTETLPDRSIPVFNPTTPTTQDNQNGQFNRYFCKKNNETRYLEIDQNTYKQLQSRDPKIAWDLYTPIVVLWIIQGNQTQVYNSNKATVQSIETNAKWNGFPQYFQEKYLKYYLGS